MPDKAVPLAIVATEATGSRLGQPFYFDGILRARAGKQAASLYTGTGAPSNSNPTTQPSAGDYYFRRDTPSTANQRIYVCTVGGSTPTWVGIV